MTVLTDKQQAFAWTIGLTGMSTAWARLARVVGIDGNRHTPLQERLVRNHALQLGKGPPGVGGIGLPLLLRSLLAMLAPRALANVGQVLQTDETGGILMDE